MQKYVRVIRPLGWPYVELIISVPLLFGKRLGAPRDNLLCNDGDDDDTWCYN